MIVFYFDFFKNSEQDIHNKIKEIENSLLSKTKYVQKIKVLNPNSFEKVLNNVNKNFLFSKKEINILRKFFDYEFNILKTIPIYKTNFNNELELKMYLKFVVENYEKFYPTVLDIETSNTFLCILYSYNFVTKNIKKTTKLILNNFAENISGKTDFVHFYENLKNIYKNKLDEIYNEYYPNGIKLEYKSDFQCFIFQNTQYYTFRYIY